jgi:hypothetical protein
VRRLQDEAARFPHDEELADLLRLATEAAKGAPRTPATESPPTLCPRFRIGNEIVSTITVIAHFHAAHDVTLDELRIELIYPADEAGEHTFARLAARI